MDLNARTLETLDWQVVLDRLAQHARTQRGAQAALCLDLQADRAGVERVYAELLDVRRLEDIGERMPIGAVLGISEQLDTARHGRVLDVVELAQVATCLRALSDLRIWLQDRAENAPALAAHLPDMELDPELVETLAESFDERGQLSEMCYPELGELRERIRGLHGRIRSTLDALLRDPAMTPLLQERYVTQRGDRYVLPVKADFKRKGLGIVHDTSGSGETVYVEPAAVVELNNRLRISEGELERAIVRILTVLSALLSRHVDEVVVALDATTAVDLACARAALGEELDGCIPELGRGGEIELKQARHPVLVLRGVDDVVPNDLALGSGTRGLILSGPNTGGKTVALKTLGLAALCCRAGVPFPALEGSRIDVFPRVIADIGDLQTVQGDLSTFSGHLLVLQAVLDAARHGTLILLDEVAVGTDPAQGAALARAVIEELVERGARLAVTTHYNDLKAFATADPRFRNAAMHLVDGQPTYQLELDAVGLSHAFATARRLGLATELVDRAESYVAADTRRVGILLEELEAERMTAETARVELEDKLRKVRQRERELNVHWERVRKKADRLAEKQAKGAVGRIQDAEDQVKSLIAELQRNPDLRLAGRTLKQIRAAREGLDPEPPKAPPAPPPKRDLVAGDRVRVRSVGRVGTVVSASRKGRAEVEVGGLKMKLKVTDLELIGAPKPAPAPEPKRAPAPPQDDGRDGSLRTSRNTVDLRGQRASDAVDQVDRFIDRLIRQGEPVAWILHGHGTGALKQAIRQWLPRQKHIEAWRAAGEDEGGDAYTRVQL
jgi:DNA mismatch repair protein MutS2